MRTLLLTIFFLTAVGVIRGAAPFVVVLGVAQDAGIPQMGCDSAFCERARAKRQWRQMVSSIGLVDPVSGRRWMFDATPDIADQFELLRKVSKQKTNTLDGIFLTHAHIGHYTGLMYLGREAMNAAGVRVYAMPRMGEMLATNAPWSQLVSLGNIKLAGLADGQPVRLGESLTVTPFLVPHRDEFSETVGFRIDSGRRKLIYLPDIDKWQKWSVRLSDLVSQNDYLLIDGTFLADGEIARPMSEVPHPFVNETMSLLSELPRAERQKVVFIHFNHSNPLVQGNRQAIQRVTRRGFGIARTGRRFLL